LAQHFIVQRTTLVAKKLCHPITSHNSSVTP
jgi:hypothetical protein